MRHYREHQAVWEANGSRIRFTPMVWSNEGRAHRKAQQVLRHVSADLARKLGVAKHEVLRRWQNDISVLLARRRARMASKILPALSEDEAYAFYGDPPGEVD